MQDFAYTDHPGRSAHPWGPLHPKGDERLCIIARIRKKVAAPDCQVAVSFFWCSGDIWVRERPFQLEVCQESFQSQS